MSLGAGRRLWHGESERVLVDDPDRGVFLAHGRGHSAFKAAATHLDLNAGSRALLTDVADGEGRGAEVDLGESLSRDEVDIAAPGVNRHRGYRIVHRLLETE